MSLTNLFYGGYERMLNDDAVTSSPRKTDTPATGNLKRANSTRLRSRAATVSSIAVRWFMVKRTLRKSFGSIEKFVVPRNFARSKRHRTRANYAARSRNDYIIFFIFQVAFDVTGETGRLHLSRRFVHSRMGAAERVSSKSPSASTESLHIG